MDLEIHKSLFLHQINSRWLTLLPALETILAQLPAAEKYFFDFLPHKKEYEKTLPNNKRYIRIQHLLKNENTLKVHFHGEWKYYIENSNVFCYIYLTTFYRFFCFFCCEPVKFNPMHLIDVKFEKGQRERSICKYGGRDPKTVQTKAR